MDMTTSTYWDLINATCSGELRGQALQTAYNDWSPKYNQDYAKAAYNGPKIGAMKMAEIIRDKHCQILDVGCGTGQVGELMAKRGFTNLHGVDFSEKSIEVARATGCYRSVRYADLLNGGIPDKDNEYDALVTVGTFCPGHLNTPCFPEFARVVKPGGLIVLVMREANLFNSPEFNNGQVDSAIVELSKNGTLRYLKREWVPNYLDDMPGIIFVFQTPEI
ncbi:methyltransferase-like protein 27 [Strongylocentrotus purpuratus]|uniref:Methyltransferase domain-containing protein n=1 Tax=Strongylocentrotus purpuratus TaxID=7668 RepID=A0A7M7GJ70_STRPU|nr:methyltransferase-like protein 27 [Strongylocentrotus purpuratus]XP_030840732.1 methyltransferase-like protein 27 [Strongylocentrotus purpuratus]|eukprot:XP_003729853.1 PREDICTED: Williams-Beuren syndrome chromosomal region 27 protein [Strongylocentrotus purpuratus]